MRRHAIRRASQASEGIIAWLAILTASVWAPGLAIAQGQPKPVSTPAAPAVAPAEFRERYAGTFWQGAVGKGADGGGWNVWLSIYEPGANPRDTHLSADKLTGEAYGDRPHDRAGWRIEGRSVPGRRFVWREHAEGMDRSGQSVVHEGGTLSGTISADGASASGTWSDGSRNRPVTLRRAAHYREVAGFAGQALLTERYPVTGDAATDALVQSLRLRRCATDDTECVVRISAHDLGETVSLLRMTWNYSGGAHGNYGFTAGNWRRGPQGFLPLTLADVLNPGAACLQRLNTRLIDELRREGAPDAARGALKEADLRRITFPFTLRGDRIVVHYGPYEVGPYSSGAFHASVRVDDLGAACGRPFV